VLSVLSAGMHFWKKMRQILARDGISGMPLPIVDSQAAKKSMPLTPQS
jgi:hypothetical protein